jgi:hypothetical protein
MAKKNGKAKGKNGEEKKPRTEWVYGVTPGLVESLTIHIDAVTGAYSIPELDPSSMYNQVSHERDSGKDKIITQFPLGTGEFYLDNMWQQLTSSFDYLMAVDTNYYSSPEFREKNRGYAIGVCSSIVIKERLTDLGGVSFEIKQHKTYLIATTQNESLFEPAGWHLALSALNPDLLKGCRLGVIVDHGLGDLPSMNKREIGYYKDFILPEYAQFIYASADKSENEINKIFQYCDKAGKAILDHFKASGFALPATQKVIDIDGLIVSELF